MAIPTLHCTGRRGQRGWPPTTRISFDAGSCALAIVEALRARLTPAERERLTHPPTRNTEAFLYFDRGRQYLQRVPGPARLGSPLGLQEILTAERLFQRAIEIDQGFALARAHLAQVHGELFFFGYDRSATRREMLRSEAHAASRLQPDLPEARLAMGWYWYLAEEDYDRALAEFEAARDGMPNDPHVWMMIANVHRRRARWPEALFGYERAFRLDPHHSDKAINLGRTYLGTSSLCRTRSSPSTRCAWITVGTLCVTIPSSDAF